MTSEPSKWNQNPNEWINLSVFMLKSVRSYWKLVGQGIKVWWTRGNLARPVRSGCSWCPLVVGDKDPLSLWGKGGHLSQEGFMTCFGEVQTVLFAHAISHVPFVLNIQYAKLSHLMVACPRQHIQTSWKSWHRQGEGLLCIWFNGTDA